MKAIGYLIPLMDNESANYYTREVMVILIREFQSPDEEMKKIVLKVRGLGLRQGVGRERRTERGREWMAGGGGRREGGGWRTD